MRNRPHLITNIISSIMLLVAIAPMPNDYYSVLRWVVFISSLHLAGIAYFWRKHGNWWVAIVFGCIAMLFNPNMLANMDKRVWILVDLVCVGLFIYTLFMVRKPPEKAMLIKVEDDESNYGIWHVLSGLLGAAFFTFLVFLGLMMLRETLMIFDF